MRIEWPHDERPTHPFYETKPREATPAIRAGSTHANAKIDAGEIRFDRNALLLHRRDRKIFTHHVDADHHVRRARRLRNLDQVLVQAPSTAVRELHLLRADRLTSRIEKVDVRDRILGGRRLKAEGTPSAGRISGRQADSNRSFVARFPFKRPDQQWRHVVPRERHTRTVIASHSDWQKQQPRQTSVWHRTVSR